MSIELTVPQLGESISEAVVGKWHKKVGDAVNVDEPIVVLETDKVTVDVPAPAAGALSKIAHQEGDKVKVGDVLGTIQEGAAGKASPPAVVSASPATELGGAGARPTPVQAPAPPPLPSKGNGRSAQATPVAKRVAQERGVDLSIVRGTGPGGRILKDDVLGVNETEPRPERSGSAEAEPAESKAQRYEVAAPARERTPPAVVPTGPRARADREERVKMTPLRKRVAERLLAAQSNAAILTTFNECDVSEVQRLRKTHGEKFLAKHGVKLGFMSFFVRASIEALKAFPQVNAEIDGDDVVFKHYYDIGVAVSGSRGLVVPVLRDADQLSMAEIEKQIADFGVRARSDKLTLADLQGGTFTISNGGVFGSMLSTPILNPPQTGILGMHNIVDRPVARDGQVVIRPVMYLALSYDHRLVDGREAVQFLVRVKECIEDPERLLLEI